MAKSKVEALNDYLNDESLEISLDEQIRSTEEYDNDSFLDGMSEASKQALYKKSKIEVKEQMNTPTTIMDVLALDLLAKIKQSDLRMYNFNAEQISLIVKYIEEKLKEK